MLLIAKARMLGTRRSVMGDARTSPYARNSNSAMNMNVVNKMSVFDRRRSGCVAVNGNGNGNGNGNFQEVKTLNNNMQTVQSRYFSSGMKIDGVQVEVTKSSQHQIETQENRSNDAAKNTGTCTGNGNGGGNGNDESSSESNSNSQLKRNEQQKAEEEIYMLNSHVQQHFQNSNYTSALSTSQEVLQKSTDLFGLTHPATASAYNNIGLMHKMMGDFQLSRENYHRALNVYRDVPGIGTDHASYAAALNNLGNLDRAQSTMDDDEGLSSLERMQLNDSAVEYLEEAYKIRKVELGAEHVYTVTSRSNLGGAIAAQVLKQEWMRQKRLMEFNKSNADANDASGNVSANASDGENQKQNEEVWTVSKYTREKWDVAEEHLRAAMRTAVNNPRGERVEIPTSTRTNMNMNTNTNIKDDDNTVKRRDKSLSKKEKQKAAKLRKKQQREERKEAAVAAKTSSSQSTTDDLGLGVGDISICTLSSAAAAQNLAVFLKSRADLVVHSQSQAQLRSTDSGSGSLHELDSNDMYAEAKNLYLGALRVRTALKGDNHPDTVATKFSLAELIDAIGDEAGANLLRQQLLDAYQVEEHDGAGEGESEEDTKQ